MRVIYGLGKLKGPLGGPRCVVTVGVFDGVHRGHQKILRSVTQAARRYGQPSVVVTFAFHPSRLVQPQQKISLLSSLEQKLSYLKKEGIDRCYVIDFDKTFAALSAESFIRDVLLKKIKMGVLYVGEDFVFGKGARGNVELLKKLAIKFRFKLRVFRHLKIHDHIVSSTLIRKLIQKGRFSFAKTFLGRSFVLSATVVSGEGRGRLLGFPTANLEVPQEIVIPDGIYATKVLWKNQALKSIAYMGTRPTFHKKSKKRTLEVFLFSFLKNIYGHPIEVQFIKKIRDSKVFPSQKFLASQIKKDVAAAKKILR